MSIRTKSSQGALPKAGSRPKKSFAKHLLLLTASLLSLPTAQGAQPSTGEKVAAKEDDIVITGSRFERTVTDSAVPIDVLTAAALEQTGKLNVRDALQQIVPSYNNTAGWTGGSGEAVKSASLRGLGADQTLVLVNGKRRHATSLVFVTARANVGTSPVDLDLISASSIKHIEVLRDGAAAQYGSDALAGVINVVLKDSPEGGDGSLTLGRNGPKPDGVVGGNNGETINLLASQGFSLGDTGFLRLNVDINAHNGTNRVGPQAYLQGSLPRIYYPGDPREATADRHRQMMGLPTQNTWNFSYNAEKPVGDIELYSFGTASYQHSWNYGIYRTAGSQQNLIEIYPEGYTPEFVIDTKEGQVVGGARGKGLLGWNWDASTSYSYTDSWEKNENSLNPSLGPSDPTRDFDNGHLIAQELIGNLDFTRQFDLGRPLQVGAGAEFRKQTFEEVAGQPESYITGTYVFPSTIPTGPLAGQTNPLAGKAPSGGASGLAGFSPDFNGQHDRHNTSLYLDLNQEVSDRLEVGVATRYEDYSDFGTTISGKLSGRFKVLDTLSLRGSLSNGFKAPSLQQQTYGSSLPNYIQDVTNPGGPLILSVNRYVPATSAIGKVLGATALRPEKSKNETVGFVWEPTSRINLTVDAYQIDITDRILSTGSLSGPRVNQLLGTIGETPAAITFFTNAADTQTKGVDLVGTWKTDWGKLGNVNWTLTSAFNRQKITRLAPTPAPLVGASPALVLFDRGRQGDLTVAYPKNRTSLAADWSLGDWNVNVRETSYSDVEWRDGTVPARDSVAKGKFITDLDLTYAVSDNTKITIGANNLLNTYPDQINQQAQLNWGWPATAPVYNLFSPFGYNGGYYYARLSKKW